MASWQAHVLDLVVRLMIKRRMKGITDIKKVRAALGGREAPIPPDIRYREAHMGGVAGEWLEHAESGAPVLLYLHGGGYVACSPRTHRPLTAQYAREGFRVYVPDYRLAPEHPYPAAVDDAEAVYDALLRETGGPIVVSGESAGGGLTLALMQRLRAAGKPMPAAVALFSPWTDLAITGRSIQENAGREAMLWGPGASAGAALYLAGADPRDPQASPLYGDWEGAPPMLIHVGAREILRDDAVRMADVARAAGVPVRLRIWPVVIHAWQIAQGFLPEAAASITEAAAFLQGARAVAAARPPAEMVAMYD